MPDDGKNTEDRPRRSVAERVRHTRSWLWASLTDEAPLVYRRSIHGRQGPRVRWLKFLLFIREIIRNFVNVQGSARAASLAYTTLLSLIPLVVALSQILRSYFAKVFPDFRAQMDAFLNMIMPYQSAQIAYHLNKFAENAETVSTFGTIAFLVVSFRLFMAVEATINKIWDVPVVRGYRQKFIAFTMLFFWGPILIGLSFTTSASMNRNPYLRAISENDFILELVPITVLFIAFTMLFWLVPATRVQLKSAVIGACITTALFQLVRFGFGVYARHLFTGRLNLIYGTLGLLVLFLIALEVLWVIILLGVQISKVYQNFHGIIRATEQQIQTDPKYDVYFGLRAMVEIARRFERRDEAPSSYRLAEEFGATDPQMLAILRRLEDAQLVKEIGGDWTGFVPGGDPDRITIEEVVRQIEGASRLVPDTDPDEMARTVIAGLFQTLDSCYAEGLQRRTIGQLVRDLARKRAGIRQLD